MGWVQAITVIVALLAATATMLTLFWHAMMRVLDARFEAVDARFESVDARFDSLAHVMDARFETVNHRLDVLERSLAP